MNEIEGIEDSFEVRLIQTHLSAKPKANSLAVTLLILMVCTLLSELAWQNIPWAQSLAATPAQVFAHHEYWKAFTTQFLHADWGHLLSNAYMLGILSYFTYAYYGFWIFPVLTVFLSGVVNLLALWTYPPDVQLIGASGLVYLLAGFWLTLFIGIERQHSLATRWLRAVGVALVILFPSTFEPQVSYRTHGFGLAIGILAGVLYFWLYRYQLRAKEVYEFSPL